MENITAFNFHVLLVLDKLYDSFPERIDLNSTDIMLEKLWDVLEESEKSKYLKYLPDTIDWLAEEGFIKYEKLEKGVYSNTTLTLRGLTILGYIPESLKSKDEEETLIEKVKRTVSSGLEASASGMVRLVVGKVLMSAFTHISS